MMTLNLYVASLGEVPANLQWLYRLDAERGGYKLDCDLDQHVAGLKSALATERATVKAQRLIITELREEARVVSIGGD
jgi:hypothetical protein